MVCGGPAGFGVEKSDLIHFNMPDSSSTMPLCRLLRRYDGMDFEFNQIRPMPHPLVEKRPIRGLHDLIAGSKALGDPARDIREAFRRQSPALSEPPIHGRGVTISEVLDNHI
jgi:hypothetical protein